MNLSFMNLMLDRCTFPDDAKDFMSSLAKNICELGLEDEFDGIVRYYIESGCDSNATDKLLTAFSEKSSANFYSCWLLLLLLAAESAKPLYEKRGVTEEVFFDTFADLRYKALECLEEHGVWGIFVPFWYVHFIKCNIIKFGRLEYEDGVYNGDEPYTVGDITLKKGMPIKHIHIPSSGEGFDLESRLASYRMAYEFYTKETGLDKLYGECHSWLLYPDYESILPEKSNILSFRHDFDIIEWGNQDSFADAWRLFGKEHRLPIAEYPENTSMRRAFKKYLLEGGKCGEGIGYLIFDGERLLTERR